MLCLQMYDNYEVFGLSNFKILGNTHNHILVQTHLELKLQFVFNTVSINLLFFSLVFVVSSRQFVLIAFLSSFKRLLNSQGLKQLHRIQNNSEVKVSFINLML